mgnify:CR=1 FL=1
MNDYLPWLYLPFFVMLIIWAVVRKIKNYRAKKREESRLVSLNEIRNTFGNTHIGNKSVYVNELKKVTWEDLEEHYAEVQKSTDFFRHQWVNHGCCSREYMVHSNCIVDIEFERSKRIYGESAVRGKSLNTRDLVRDIKESQSNGK